MILKKFPNPQDAASAAGLLLSQQEGSILFLSSGGSALQVLDHVDRAVIRKWTVSVVDERLEGLSNFEELLRKINVAHFIKPIPADNFEKQLRIWKKDHLNGRIIVTLGIGPDGHTAGIMAGGDDKVRFKEQFDTPDRWVVQYDAGTHLQYPHRITTTFPFLRLVDLAIVYVCGQDKAKVLSRALAPTGSLIETPARIIGEMPRVFLFTDITI